MTTSPPAARPEQSDIPRLSAAELVDDRALKTVDADAFRLNDFVEELVALTETVEMPANIALFAAWGSGKTSLANLLETRLRNHGTIAFARFDAFKYAGVALRRHFISQLAFAFRVKRKRYGRGLYTDERRNRIEPTRRDIARAAGAFLTISALVLGASSAAAALIAVVSTAKFLVEFKHVLHVAAPEIVIASGLLGTLTALFTQGLTVESTSYAPSSEEQFERLFRALVADVRRRRRRDRLVILIDELDRCPASDVVTILETLKTFLEVPHCIFIVSADQHAIEHAVAQETQQATPIDTANPYYSAGTAYLDKIFQYQLALPPLLPKTLSKFALNLIEKKPGVWTRVADRPGLVTVLIPAHVRSPRRVKVLLNAFALSYRLALERAAAGTLDAKVDSRASELAKLVCLRTEFPLFAGDLQLDARLPELVLTLSGNSEVTFSELAMPGLSEEVFNRARFYAEGRLPVDDVLAHRVTRTVTRTQEGAEENEREGEDAVEVDDHGPERRALAQKQARQLLDYLRRTQEVTGPGRDLIFLESPGPRLTCRPT